MPQIEVTDATFKKLQALATPFVDTPNTVIDRLIDYFRRGQSDSTIEAPETEETSSALKFDPGSLPSLTHTKLKSAVIADRLIDRPTWNRLVRIALEVAFTKSENFEELRRATDARIVKGIKTDEGYTPIIHQKFSVQGVDAPEAFRIIFGIARKFSLPFEIFFEWRDKEDAAFPGELGEVAWKPLEGQ